MELRLKIRPTTFEGKTREEVMRKIYNHCDGHSYGGKGSLCSLMDKNKNPVAYSLQKIHKKVKVTKKKETSLKGTSFKRKVESKTKWVAFLYTFPKDVMGTITQKSRNFEFSVEPRYSNKK